jgi:hypothetical protein
MASIDVIIQGTNLNSFGFVTDNTSTSPLGLNTFGLVMACSDIWVTADDDITTTWTDCSDGATGPGVCLD